MGTESQHILYKSDGAQKVPEREKEREAGREKEREEGREKEREEGREKEREEGRDGVTLFRLGSLWQHDSVGVNRSLILSMCSSFEEHYSGLK